MPTLFALIESTIMYFLEDVFSSYLCSASYYVKNMVIFKWTALGDRTGAQEPSTFAMVITTNTYCSGSTQQEPRVCGLWFEMNCKSRITFVFVVLKKIGMLPQLSMDILQVEQLCQLGCINWWDKVLFFQLLIRIGIVTAYSYSKNAFWNRGSYATT